MYDSIVMFAYCYSVTTWISYDDNHTISTKVNYAREAGLKGYFAWHVGGDDNWVLSQTGEFLSDSCCMPLTMHWKLSKLHSISQSLALNLAYMLYN